MKWALPVVTLGLCLSYAFAECKRGWQGGLEIGACYKMYFNKVTWVDAAFNYCAMQDDTMAQTMVEPRTQAQWDFLKNDLAGHFWLGITDTFNDGHWYYKSDSAKVSNETIPWKIGEPDSYVNGDEDCLLWENGKVRDFPCDHAGEKRDVLCQYTHLE